MAYDFEPLFVAAIPQVPAKRFCRNHRYDRDKTVAVHFQGGRIRIAAEEHMNSSRIILPVP